jgi:hypothetical protein
MHSPYTADPLNALVIAQSSVAAALSAVVWWRPIRPWISSALLLAGAWIVALLPVAPDFFIGLGGIIAPEPALRWLRVAAMCATLAMLAARRQRWLAVVALPGQAVLSWLVAHIPSSDDELAALHLIWIASLYGAYVLAESPRAPRAVVRRERTQVSLEISMAALAMILALIVNLVVLDRGMDSSDEWAYTYQAATFAKLHAYALKPACYAAFQNFWVFSASGHTFSQYTPGWPLFMAPFFRLGVVWLAGPASLGLLVVGVARLARRITAACGDGGRVATSREVTASGLIAGGATLLSNTMLINGASRFSHVFVAATFAWSVEALCAITTPGVDRRSGALWGIVLGLGAGFMVSTRPADGATLGLGLLLYFAYAALRGRLSGRGAMLATVAFAAAGGLTLVLLRLQLGQWFKTGYALTHDFYPSAALSFSAPDPSELRYGLPLATGSYCWWPLAPALGIAGLLTSLRSAERRVAFILGVGTLAFLGFYTMLELGRGYDWGYGPRYVLPSTVAMAVGTGALFAPLARGAFSVGSPRRAFSVGGPPSLALAAVAVGVVRLAPLIYPYNHDVVTGYNILFKTIEEANIHNAVVLYKEGSGPLHELDATRNLPLDLYPDQDILVVADHSPELNRCVRDLLPRRKFYRYLPELNAIAPDS